jgi:putative ABC transport system permease protein
MRKMRRKHRLSGSVDPRRDLNEELEFHLQRRADELRREGLPPEEAMRRAGEEFGDLEGTRAYCEREDRKRDRMERPVRFARALKDGLTTAARALARRPGAVAGPVVILATAIALNALVFTVVRGVLLTPLPFQDPDHVALVRESAPGGGLGRTSYPVLDAWRREATGVTAVAGYLTDEVTLSTGEVPHRVHSTDVTAGFFDLLDRPLVRGRWFTAEEQRRDGPPVALISEGLWRNALGGDTDVLRRPLRINGSEFSVVGIVRGGAVFPDGTDIWLPLERMAPGLVGTAGAKIVLTLVHLRSGVSLATLSEALGRISASVPGGAPAASVVMVRQHLLGNVRSPLLLLQGAVLLVLLTACANAGGMLLARGVRRRGELAVRHSVGAGAWRVAAELVLEGLLLGAGAGLLGLGAAAALLHPALRLAPPDLPRATTIHLDPWVVSFALGLAVVTGVLTAAVPALSGARTSPASFLREASGPGSTPWLRRLLEGFVVVQVALAVLLTVGAGLLLRSFVATVREDPGFDPASVTVLDVNLPEARYPDSASRLAFARALLDRARRLPGARNVALGRNLPVSESNMLSPLMVDGSPKPTDAVQVAQVSSGYFDVLRIPVVNGSGFGAADHEGGPPEIVVDQGVRTAEGDALHVGDRAHSFFGDTLYRRVVGVAGPVRHADLRTPAPPTVYEPFFQKGGASGFSLLVRSDAPTAIVARSAQGIVRSLDPEIPVDAVGTMNARISRSLAEPRFYTVTLGVFGSLALLLALAGCQAGLAHRVAERRSEIGVRMALGASSGSVRGMILMRGLFLSAVGASLGLLVAIPATGILRDQLYRVTESDPITYVGIVVLLMAAATVASDLPARRASSTDPAKVLREE